MSRRKTHLNLIFAAPTYGPTPDPSLDRNHRMAIMFAANRGFKWVGDASPDRMGWAAARNWTIENALIAGDDVDGIFWCDDDIMMPVETIFKLATYGKDFVSALYFQRLPPHWPVAAVYNESNFNWWSDYPLEPLIVPTDGVGFGCVYTSMKMIRAIKADLKNDETVFGGDFGKRTYGEDFLFCLRAAKVGFKPYVDTGVKCQHYMTPQYADEGTYQRERQRIVSATVSHVKEKQNG